MTDYLPPSVRAERFRDVFEENARGLPCTARIVTTAPGGVLSRHYHHKRDEIWIVLDPGARVELGEDVLYPNPEDKLFIPRETAHKLISPGSSSVRILEASFGEFDEDDIVRLEDV